MYAYPGCDDGIAQTIVLELIGLMSVFGKVPTEDTTWNARVILELLVRTDLLSA